MKNEEIKELMEIFDTSNISRLKIKRSDCEIELEKKVEQVSFNISPQESNKFAEPALVFQEENKVENKVQDNQLFIKSPMVGTFYEAPQPGAKPYIQVGEIVKKGQTLAIIEAMKIMNEIEAEFDCKIIKVLVSDGQPVEYDMPLYGVELL